MQADQLNFSNLKSDLTRKIELNVPFVSAAMDTVTEFEAAIAMARLGGIGIIHKNMDIDTQVLQCKKVKKSEFKIYGLSGSKVFSK